MKIKFLVWFFYCQHSYAYIFVDEMEKIVRESFLDTYVKHKRVYNFVHFFVVFWNFNNFLLVFDTFLMLMGTYCIIIFYRMLWFCIHSTIVELPIQERTSTKFDHVQTCFTYLQNMFIVGVKSRTSLLLILFQITACFACCRKFSKVL